MTVEQAVRDHLVATSAVSDLVSSRVYQLILPQKPTLPAVRVQLIDQPRTAHLRGMNGTSHARVQVDAYGRESDGYAAVAALADAIDGALSGAVFSVGSPSEIEVVGAFREMRKVLYESGELRLVRVLQDYTVWSRQVN